mgnify:CR=1 FL=1
MKESEKEIIIVDKRTKDIDSGFKVPNWFVDEGINAKLLNFDKGEIYTSVLRAFSEIYKEGVSDGRNEFPYGIAIPSSLLLLKISSNSKIVLATLIALSKSSGYCYASNNYISKSISFTEKQLRSSLEELTGNSLIKIDVKRNEQGTSRKIFVNHTRLEGTPFKTYPPRPKGPVYRSNTNTIKNKDTSTAHKDAVALIDYFKEQYQNTISSNGEEYKVNNWGRWIKAFKQISKDYTVKRTKELIDAYFNSNDKFYKSNAWSMNMFVNEGVLNKLNQTVKRNESIS